MRPCVSAALIAVALVSACCSPFVHAGDVDYSNKDLVIHIIPHSHCDPGWLETFDGYYNGQVRNILNSVTNELGKSPRRRFVWAETSFFMKWWDEQNEARREQFRSFVQSGQVEFVGGGWVQNDEAGPWIPDITNQVVEGHETLNQLFGVTPRIAWQIDPFGHSRTNAAMWAAMGYEALVINRIHYAKKTAFKSQKHMEFLWRVISGLPDGEGEIFTHVLHTHYSAPLGFDFEEGWSAVPVNTGNAQARADAMVRAMKDRQTSYRTKHLLVTFGDDFKFRNAALQFNSMDMVMDKVNEMHPGVHMRYSTLSEYFSEVSSAGAAHPRFEGDFFPYADNEDSYWTGYYTTKPRLKQLSRTLSGVLRNADALYAAGRADNIVAEHALSRMGRGKETWFEWFQKIREARRSLALAMHHDAITGTARQHVDNDYTGRLNRGIEDVKSVMSVLLSALMAKPDYSPAPFAMEDDPSGSSERVAVVFSSLGQSHLAPVKIQCATSDASVTIPSLNNEQASSQIVYSYDDMGKVSLRELYFSAPLPAMGARAFLVTGASKSARSTVTVWSNGRADNTIRGVASAPGETMERKWASNKATEYFTLQNEDVEVRLSQDTGLLHSIRDKKTNTEHQLRQKLMFYQDNRGGAYIFRPEGEARPLIEGETFVTTLNEGPLVSRAVTTVGRFKQIVTVFNGPSDRHVEVELHGFANRNQNVVSRFETTMMTQDFHTDEGLYLYERQGKTGSIQSRYYPSTMGATVVSGDTQLSIVTSHTVGFSMITAGALEMMFHRNLGQDDGRGMGEPNNDNGEGTIVYRVLVGDKQEVEAKRRPAAMQLNNKPTIAFAPRNVQESAKFTANFDTELRLLEKDLPDGLHVMSFKSRDATGDDTILQIQDLGKGGLTVDLSTMFANHDVYDARRRTLSMVADHVTLKERLPFRALDGVALDNAAVPVAAAGNEARQNTDEEGVFISDIAKQMAKPAGRRLMSAGGAEYTLAPLKYQIVSLFVTMARQRTASELDVAFNARGKAAPKVAQPPADKPTKAPPSPPPPSKQPPQTPLASQNQGHATPKAVPQDFSTTPRERSRRNLPKIETGAKPRSGTADDIKVNMLIFMVMLSCSVSCCVLVWMYRAHCATTTRKKTRIH